MSDQNDTTQQDSSAQVICTAAMDPIIRSAVITFMFLGAGVYSVYELVIGKFADDASSRIFTWGVAIVGIPVGLFLLCKTISKLRRTLIACDKTIGFSDKDQVAWESITKIIIKSKGLMDLHYNSGGQDRVLTLDSWELRDFDKLTAFVESKTAGVTVEQAPKK